MITIFDKRYNMKDGLRLIPLEEIDVLDLVIGGKTANAVDAVITSNLVVIVDYDNWQYRVIKDRHTGEERIGHTNELCRLLMEWISKEQSANAIALAEESFNKRNAEADKKTS